MSGMRIAMWSGPRNISTAMMRAWENRGDCAVSDEPLYAAYLAATGLDHPGRDEVIAAGETDPACVIAALLGPIPDGKPIWYQKHMSHHLLPDMAHDWIHQLTNVFLIRDPDEVVASYLKSRATVTPEDLGLFQQSALFDELVEKNGPVPTVIDASDFLQAPEAYLRAICAQIGIDFSGQILRWPAGPRNSDGIWARHWYDAVWKSTGFETWQPRKVDLDDSAMRVVDACRPIYERLRERRLRIPQS